jgi:hypothetical protein
MLANYCSTVKRDSPGLVYKEQGRDGVFNQGTPVSTHRDTDKVCKTCIV